MRLSGGKSLVGSKLATLHFGVEWRWAGSSAFEAEWKRKQKWKLSLFIFFLFDEPVDWFMSAVLSSTLRYWDLARLKRHLRRLTRSSTYLDQLTVFCPLKNISPKNKQMPIFEPGYFFSKKLVSPGFTWSKIKFHLVVTDVLLLTSSFLKIPRNISINDKLYWKNKLKSACVYGVTQKKMVDT